MSPRPGLSVVLITRNEAARIRRCLDSVQWADEIVVVDQHSQDGTAEICRQYGARVIARDMTAGFGEQKNFALAQATQPWVLSLDADEEVTEPLRREIEAAVAAPGACVGFRMPRLTSYLGRFIRHCGWYPSPVLRLVRRGCGRFTDALVHEELSVDGPVGDLRADLIHRSYASLAEHVRKLLLYTAHDARMLQRRGGRVDGLAALWGFALKPPATFVRKYVVQGGFREGWHGFVLSAMAALVVLVNQIRLAELTGRLPTAPAPRPAPNDPPTVLLMANFADLVGGGEESLLALAARLDRHRVRPVASVPAEGEVAERLRALGVPVTVVPLPALRPWRLVGVARAIRRLRGLLGEAHVALVHAQGGRGALYAGLAGRGRGVPVVWHARTADPDRWLDPVLVRLAHTIVANSGATACRFRRWPRVRVTVIPNGVDLGRFGPAPADADLRRALGVPEGPVVGYVGRLEHGKGPDVLLAAAERLALKIPGVTVLFVGDGPLRSALTTQATDAAVRAVFAGQRLDVPALLRLCDVLAVPSRQEAFGRVLIEAMACRVPVVATAVGGIPEVCADGFTGLLVPPDDPDALATALAATLTDTEATGARVRAAAADVQARFDIGAHAARVHAVYDAVLGSTRCPTHSTASRGAA